MTRDLAEPAPEGLRRDHRFDVDPAGRREALEARLAELAAVMAYEAAHLFVPRGRGWELAARTGPERPWHSVLDPSSTGQVGTGLVFADARSMPGVGPRLAAMGCGAIAILPVPGGGRVILDAASRRRGTPPVERAHPALDRVSALVHPTRPPTDLAALERVERAIREALSAPEADLGRVIESVCGAIGAEEFFHLIDRGGGVQVTPAVPAPTASVRAALRSLPRGTAPDDAAVGRLAAVLDASSPTVSAWVLGDGRQREGVVIGWPGAPTVSRDAVRLIAEMIRTARTLAESRRDAVDELMTKERNRWAYEIHDGLTQAVTTAVLELEVLEREIERDPRAAARAIAATRSEIRRSLADVRSILYELHRDEPARLPQDEPLSKYINDVVQRWKLPARVSISGDLHSVPKQVLGVTYVVVREALANAAKHAAAGTVTVTVDASPDRVRLEVSDTGKGFGPQAGAPAHERRNFGLDMIRKRVDEAGGTVSIDSAPGRGTRVVAELPARQGQR